jgi:hypothetical protein
MQWYTSRAGAVGRGLYKGHESSDFSARALWMTNSLLTSVQATSENGYGRIRIGVLLQDTLGPAGGKSSLNMVHITPAIPSLGQTEVRAHTTVYKIRTELYRAGL